MRLPRPPFDAAAPAVVEADVRGEGVEAGPSKGPLSKLAAGHTVMAEGARLVVPDGSSVVLSRGGERAVVLGHADVTVGRSGAALLETRAGRVLLASPSPGIRIDVPGGSIVLTAAGAGSVQAQVTVERRTAHVVSNQGQLELRGRSGIATLGAGESGTLDDSGGAAAEVTAPKAADVTIPAGESPVVHSPRGTAAVRIRLEGVCPGDALVESISGGVTRTVIVHGQSLSAVVLSARSRTSQIRRALRGRGRIARGPAGERDHRRRARQRRRTVAANRAGGPHRRGRSPLQRPLPNPAAEDLVSLASRPGRSRSIAAHRARQRAVSSLSMRLTDPWHYQPALLPRGLTVFWFDVDGEATNRSPDTTLRIAFDNAAPAAEIQQPVDGQPSGGTVHVAGVASEGASVSVGGAAIALDQDLRFRADVPAPVGDRSLAIRISHPSRGVHYYLRMIGAP
jgi:hypothetical protein